MEWMEICLVKLSLVLTLFVLSHAAHFYTDNGLSQTIIVDRIPRSERRILKHDVLQLLGLHHRPRPSHHPRRNSAPNFMMGLYKLIEEHEDAVAEVQWSRGSLRRQHDEVAMMNLTLRGNEANIDQADVIISLVNQARSLPEFDVNRRFYFDFSNVPRSGALMEAELRLFKHPVLHMRDRGPFIFKLYRIVQGVDWEELYMEVECNMTVSAGESGWIIMNTSSSAQHWAYSSSSNHGLYLTVTDAYGYELSASDIGISDETAPDDEHAFLVAFFKAPQHLVPRVFRSRKATSSARTRRDVQYYYGYSKSVCQKHDLFVSFQDLRWQDWIIAPASYAAYYCHGECKFPLSAHMNATNHAIVQTLMHVINGMDVPAPCCVPVELKPISVLYFDDDSNVILKKFKNMVVRSCGCH